MVCDFQAVYRLRIDPDAGDLGGLSGPQFFRYATRLPAYQGAVAAQIARLRDDTGTVTVSTGQQSPGGPPAQVPQQVEATPLNLTTHPLMRQFFDYSQAVPEATEAG